MYKDVHFSADVLRIGTIQSKNIIILKEEIKMKEKHRFSLRNKLMIVFGLLILAVGTILAVIGIRTARKAVTEKSKRI